MIEELDMGPRLNGRAAKAVTAVYLRELGPSDIALLETERGIKPPSLKKLRDRHHALARCLAQGMRDGEASAVTGYDPSRISILKRDPAFAELVASYREHEDTLLADFTSRATMVSLTALNEIADRLEEDPEAISLGQLGEIVKMTADRTGHAPVQKVQQTNVNVELGGRLALARSRLATVPAPVLDAEFTEVGASDNAGPT